MTCRVRIISWWNRRITRKRPLRWDPIVHDWAGRVLPTDVTLGWVEPSNVWTHVFDLVDRARSLYHSFLVQYAHAQIPLDKLT